MKSRYEDWARQLGLLGPGQSTDLFEKLNKSELRNLRERLEDRQNQLLDDETRYQILVFLSNIPVSMVLHFSDDACPVSKYARLTYDITIQNLIVKVPFSPEHGIAPRAFDPYIFQELCAMGLHYEMCPLGNSTTRVGDYIKEADMCWGPNYNGHITTVFEVGPSESTQRLAASAREWLEAKDSPVRIAITMNICRDSPKIIIRRWESFPQESSVDTKEASKSAVCTDEISIIHQDDTTTVSGELILPFDKFTGREKKIITKKEIFLFLRPALRILRHASGKYKVHIRNEPSWSLLL